MRLTGEHKDKDREVKFKLDKFRFKREPIARSANMIYCNNLTYIILAKPFYQFKALNKVTPHPPSSWFMRQR